MNRLKIKNVMTMVAIAAVTLIACVPEDGDIGPVGPVGPEGPPGADGSIGRDGLDGADGGSQVKSFTYDVLTSDWDTNSTGIFSDLSVPQITADIVENGAILVFNTTDNSTPANTVWKALPYTTTIINFHHSYSTGNVELAIDLGNGQRILGYNVDLTYKVVLVPDVLRKKGINYDDLSLQQIEMIHEVKEFGVMQ